MRPKNMVLLSMVEIANNLGNVHEIKKICAFNLCVQCRESSTNWTSHLQLPY